MACSLPAMVDDRASASGTRERKILSVGLGWP